MAPMGHAPTRCSGVILGAIGPRRIDDAQTPFSRPLMQINRHPIYTPRGFSHQRPCPPGADHRRATLAQAQTVQATFQNKKRLYRFIYKRRQLLNQKQSHP
jgi:hypothetical protein